MTIASTGPTERLTSASAVLICVSLIGAPAFAAPYVLDAKAKNRVEFQSKATLESFSGKAKGISAEFDVDPENLAVTKGNVTVDLRTLDTGIEMRNKHMRENHLHTDSFPNAIFQLDSVSDAGGLGSTGSITVTIHGQMTIHGVTTRISTPAILGSVGPDALRIQAALPLKITEYGIPRPEFLFLKLAEDVRIVVDLTISRVGK